MQYFFSISSPLYGSHKPKLIFNNKSTNQNFTKSIRLRDDHLFYYCSFSSQMWWNVLSLFESFRPAGFCTFSLTQPKTILESFLFRLVSFIIDGFFSNVKNTINRGVLAKVHSRLGFNRGLFSEVYEKFLFMVSLNSCLCCNFSFSRPLGYKRICISGTLKIYQWEELFHILKNAELTDSQSER